MLRLQRKAAVQLSSSLAERAIDADLVQPEGYGVSEQLHALRWLCTVLGGHEAVAACERMLSDLAEEVWNTPPAPLSLFL